MTEQQEAAAWSMLALALEPETPPPEVRSRLLRSVHGAQRYLPFVGRLSRLFDVEVPRMRQLLIDAADPQSFSHAIVPGIRIIHFATGPAVVGRHAGLARVRQGFEFPTHRHLVEEVTVVLEGMLVEDDGRVHAAGDVLVRAPGSRHALSVIEPSVLATLVGPIDPDGAVP